MGESVDGIAPPPEGQRLARRFRTKFVFPVDSLFVCECHTIALGSGVRVIVWNRTPKKYSGARAIESFDGISRASPSNDGVVAKKCRKMWTRRVANLCSTTCTIFIRLLYDSFATLQLSRPASFAVNQRSATNLVCAAPPWSSW